MSLFDYEISKKIAAEDYPFHALMMAAARKADTFNFDALERAFPGTIAELKQRYNAPGGRLPMDGPMAEEVEEGALPDGRQHD